MPKPHVFKLFLDVHMGAGHDALGALARKAKINMNELGPSDLVLFVNRAGDKAKLLGAQGRVFAYVKHPNRHVLNSEALFEAVNTFGGAGLNYEAALKKVLEKKLGVEIH